VDWEALWAGIGSRRRAVLACGCAALFLIYGTSGWTAIGPDEVGLLQRFGRYQGTLGPGPHLRWPYPIESVTVVAPDRVRSLEIGFRAVRASQSEPLGWEASHGRQLRDPSEDEALLLTGDGRYVELAATLEYGIDRVDPDSLWRFVFDVADGENAIRPLAESVVREVISRRELLDLLTEGRREAEEAAAALLRSRLRAYRFGIAVRRVAFQDVHPPLAVLDAYRDVSRATSDRQRRINEANAHRDQVLAEVSGKSRALLHAAEAARSRQLSLAASAVNTFGSLREARRYAPALTDFRLFWKTIAETFTGRTKLVLDEEPGRRRHLILPDQLWDRMLPAFQRDAQTAKDSGLSSGKPVKNESSDPPRDPKS
jgi:HflK protein